MDINELYIQQERWIMKLASKYPIINYTYDDTVQTYGLVFMDCVAKFDPTKGKLTTLLNTACRNMAITLTKRQFVKGKSPLGSLDKVMHVVTSGSAEITMLDVIPDYTYCADRKTSKEEIEKIRDYLYELPRGEITILYYLNGKTLREIAEMYGLSIMRIKAINDWNIVKVKEMLVNGKV